MILQPGEYFVNNINREHQNTILLMIAKEFYKPQKNRLLTGLLSDELHTEEEK